MKGISITDIDGSRGQFLTQNDIDNGLGVFEDDELDYLGGALHADSHHPSGRAIDELRMLNQLGLSI